MEENCSDSGLANGTEDVSDTSDGSTLYARPGENVAQSENIFEINVTLLHEDAIWNPPNFSQLATIRRREKGCYAAKVQIDESMTEADVRELLASRLTRLRNASNFKFAIRQGGKFYFCPGHKKCQNVDECDQEWTGRNIRRAAPGNSALYLVPFNNDPGLESAATGDINQERRTSLVSLPDSDDMIIGEGSVRSSQSIGQRENFEDCHKPRLGSETVDSETDSSEFNMRDMVQEFMLALTEDESEELCRAVEELDSGDAEMTDFDRISTTLVARFHIVPDNGPMEGGNAAYLELKTPLPVIRMDPPFATFGDCEEVPTVKQNPNLLRVNSVPGVTKPGVVPVLLKTDGHLIGTGTYRYNAIDPSMLENKVTNMVRNHKKTFRRVADRNKQKGRSYSTEQGTFTNKGRVRGVVFFRMLVDTAARMNAVDFFKIVLSTSAGKIAMKSFEGKYPLIEDVAKASNNAGLAKLLEKTRKRVCPNTDSSESEDDEVDWEALARAAEQYESEGFSGDELRCTCELKSLDDDQSYNADVDSSTSESPRGTRRSVSSTSISSQENWDGDSIQGWLGGAQALPPRGKNQGTRSLPPEKLHFGRKEELLSIINNLKRHRLVTVTAPAGFGKTAVASIVGNKFLSEGHTVTYIPCDNAKTLDALANAILGRIGYKRCTMDADEEELYVRAIVRRACHCLSIISVDTLFILDGVDNLIRDEPTATESDLLSSMLLKVQSNKNVKILCTATKSFCFPDGCLASSVSFGPLSIGNAHSLMKLYLPDIQRCETETIGQLCDFMPLALHVLSRALKEDGTTPADLTVELQCSAGSWKHADYPVLFQAASYSLHRLSHQDQRIFGYLDLVRNYEFTAYDVSRVSGFKNFVVEEALQRFLSRGLVEYDPTSNGYYQHKPLIWFSTYTRVTRDDLYGENNSVTSRRLNSSQTCTINKVEKDSSQGRNVTQSIHENMDNFPSTSCKLAHLDLEALRPIEVCTPCTQELSYNAKSIAEIDTICPRVEESTSGRVIPKKDYKYGINTDFCPSKRMRVPSPVVLQRKCDTTSHIKSEDSSGYETHLSGLVSIKTEPEIEKEQNRKIFHENKRERKERPTRCWILSRLCILCWILLGASAVLSTSVFLLMANRQDCKPSQFTINYGNGSKYCLDCSFCPNEQQLTTKCGTEISPKEALRCGNLKLTTPQGNASGSNKCLLDQFVVQHANGSTDCQDCPFCPPGQEPSHRCGTNISANDVKNVHCLDCVHGKTFSSSNDTFQCYPCTETNCPDQKVVVYNCSVTADKKCGDVKCGNGMYHETSTGNCQECSWCCGEIAIDSVKKECLDGGMPEERSCSFHHKYRCKPTTVKSTNKPAPWSTAPTTAVPINKQTANTTELVPTLATSSTTAGKLATTKHATVNTTVVFITALGVVLIFLIVVLAVYIRCCYNRSGQNIDPMSGTELGILIDGNGSQSAFTTRSDLAFISSAKLDSMRHLASLKNLQAKSPLMTVCTCAGQHFLNEGMTLTEFSNKYYLEFESVCDLLDIPIKGCGNYEQVAKHYGFTAQTIQSRFEKHGDGPSKALFAWLGGTSPQLTLREFFLVLQNIKRQDVVDAFRCVNAQK